jgi:hypothetical protein
MKMYFFIFIIVLIVTFVQGRFFKGSTRPLLRALIYAGLACLGTFLFIIGIQWLLGLLLVVIAIIGIYFLIKLKSSINEENEE